MMGFGAGRAEPGVAGSGPQACPRRINWCDGHTDIRQTPSSVGPTRAKLWAAPTWDPGHVSSTAQPPRKYPKEVLETCPTPFPCSPPRA